MRSPPDEVDDLDPPPRAESGGCFLLALGILVLLGVTVVPLGVATSKLLDGLRVASAIRKVEADEAGKGEKAVVVKGLARGSATNGPSRTGSSGWIGEVGRWVRSGKSSKYVVQCTVTRVDGMHVETSDGNLTLAGFDGHAFALAHGLAIQPGQVAIDFTHDGFGSRLPADVARVCELDDSPINSFFYKERLLHEGDEVVVRGCRQGELVAACRDGLDFVTSRTTADVVRDTKDEIAPTLLWGVFLALIGLGIAGLYGGYNITGRKRARTAS